MRRPLIIAAFVVFLGLMSATAQRGGGRGFGGGRGIAVAHPSAVHSFSGMHAGPGVHSFHQDGFGGVRIRTGRFHHCFGCWRGFGVPWYGYGAYYPWWWDSSSSYDYDEEQARDLALASQMNALNVEEQRLREREQWDRERDQDRYARRSQPQAEEPSTPTPATVLVFRDQHQQEVRNYAIANGTLWVLNDHLATRKIPITELDLAATTKANDERGVEFHVPK